VPDRIGRGFGERELQVRKELVRELAEPADARQGEPAEGDVLRPRRDRESDGHTVTVGHGCHRVSFTH
jgi:hypothetical protein